MPRGYSNLTGLPLFLPGRIVAESTKSKISFKNSRNKYCMGRVLSKETKLKMSLLKKGKPISREAWLARRLNNPLKGRPVPMERRIRIGKKQIGPLNHNWKGGSTPEEKRLRNGMEYEQWRNSVYIRDSFVCQICNQKGGRLQAHHVLPFAHFPEKRFDVNNGMTVCVPCHKYIHRHCHALA